MVLLKVAQLGHPVLRQKATPVPPGRIGQPELERLIADMVETLREYDGVGLAAPQVHHSLQLIVIEAIGERAGRGDIPLTVLINPRIVEASEEMVTDWEGCLSAGELQGLVPRARRVVVEALDRRGQPLTVTAEDFFARVLQHEIDHLEAILLIDRMPDLRSLTFAREFARYWVARPEAEPGRPDPAAAAPCVDESDVGGLY
ncbi:MAG: peptide deformylase [Candidatus Tectimicrobiota bacterium]